MDEPLKAGHCVDPDREMQVPAISLLPPQGNLGRMKMKVEERGCREWRISDALSSEVTELGSHGVASPPKWIIATQLAEIAKVNRDGRRNASTWRNGRKRVLQMMKGDEQWCKSEGERVTWVPRKIRIETSAKDGVPKMG
jgi:hypothetical protein